MLPRDRLLAATDADLEAWAKDAKVIDDANTADYSARAAKYRQIRDLAADVWTGDALKKAERWLKSNTPSFPNNRWLDRVRDIRRDAEEHRRKVAADCAKDAQSADNLARMARAVLWLKERGKELERDYEAASAVAFADDIAVEEEIARMRDEQAWLDFADKNCEGPCMGWDGQNSRCQCGNRRVNWTRGYGHSFEKPYVYAEAC